MNKQKQRRKCVFNSDLEKLFPFIKKTTSNSDVRCNKCNSEFNIANSGKKAIEKHLDSQKHLKAVNAAAASRPVNEYLPSTII